MMITSQFIRSDPPSFDYDGLTFQVSDLLHFYNRVDISFTNCPQVGPFTIIISTRPQERYSDGSMGWTIRWGRSAGEGGRYRLGSLTLEFHWNLKQNWRLFRTRISVFPFTPIHPLPLARYSYCFSICSLCFWLRCADLSCFSRRHVMWSLAVQNWNYTFWVWFCMFFLIRVI